MLAHVAGAGFGAVARAFLDWAAEAEGKPRWGEKTPHHTLLFRQVLTAWPDAQVVLIERDPRDVALSWKQARFGGNHVLPFARSWVRYADAAEAIRRMLPENRVMSLCYEELVTRPEASLERLMPFLGETYEPDQLAFHQRRQVWNTDSRNAARLRTPISAESIGRWRSELSRHEVRLIETVAGDAMQRRGYDLSEPDRPVSRAEYALAKYLGCPMQRVLGLARNARGFVYLGRDLAWRLRDVGGRKVMDA